MKNRSCSFFSFLIVMALSITATGQEIKSPSSWSIVASYTIPGKASGLAWDGTYIYFGIYGQYGNNVYKFNPSNGTNVLQCTGGFEDAYGLTYKSPDLVTINQPSSSSQPSTAFEFTMSGTTVSTLNLPDHYMSGIAWDNGNYWVCTYYPNPGIIYKVSATGTVLSQFTPPADQPWDICKQGNDLWIADYNANTLYKVSTTGTVIESHPTANVNPSGVVFDGTYLWYCDGPLGANSTLYKVDLTGTGTPDINIPVASHDYGTVAIGQFSTWNCAVQNTGTANLTISEIEIPSGQPVTTTLSTPQVIAPGASLNIPLKYMPIQPEALDCNVIIHSSDPIHPEKSVNLTGQGVYQGPHILLTDTYHDFGLRRAGAYSKWILPIKNNGNQNVVISNLSFTNPSFMVDESVTLPLTIMPLATTYVPVWFHPTDDLNYTDVLTIVSNALSQETLYVNFSGSGEVNLYPIGTPLWTYQINAGFDNSPKSIVPIDDVTGDGIGDVIVGSEDYYIRCFNGNASVTGDIIWERLIPAGPVYEQKSISIIQDINGDGFKDVIAGTTGGDESIIALSGKTGLQLWKHQTNEYGGGGWVYQVDSKRDFNSDGFPDVLAATGDDGNGTGPRRVYCLNGMTGASLWERYVAGPVFSVISVDDFTGDSKPDAVAGASNDQETIGKVIGIDGVNGSQKWTYNTPGSSVWGLMQLDDITGDGKKDIAAGDFSGNLIYLNAATGTNIHQISMGNVLILHLVDIGDVNKNGFTDVLVAHSGTNARVVDGNLCTFIWSQPVSDKSWCVANAGDLTWDGINDVLVGTLYQNNNAYFLDGGKGSILNTYASADPVDGLSAIADITNDSTMEMLFGDRSGLLTCLSGGFDSTTIKVRDILVNPFSFLLFSNPNNGDFTIKFTTMDKISVDISVYDMEGRVLTKIPKVNFMPGSSILELDLRSSLNDGVYIVEATSVIGCYKEKLIVKK
ncbi:MAG: FG-GAP-like repeat-containing protein [Chloroflexota bacterium]